MKKRTDELLKILEQTQRPSEYIENNKEYMLDESLQQSLANLLAKSEMEKSEVIKSSGLDRTYAYQIFAGTKNPSRDKLIALVMAMKLGLKDIQALLKSNSYPVLYPKVKRDSVIIFAIQKQLSLMETNDLLYEMDLDTLE